MNRLLFHARHGRGMNDLRVPISPGPEGGGALSTGGFTDAIGRGCTSTRSASQSAASWWGCSPSTGAPIPRHTSDPFTAMRQRTGRARSSPSWPPSSGSREVRQRAEPHPCVEATSEGPTRTFAHSRAGADVDRLDWVVLADGPERKDGAGQQVVGNIVSEWSLILSLVWFTKYLIERGSKESHR